MYCPRCATHLAATTTRCSACDLDLQAMVQLLHRTNHPSASQARRWKQQRHGWGLLLILCSFLVGCLIPVSLGLLGQLTWIGSLITALAGFAGLLFVLGTMLILAAEGTILATDDASPDPIDDRAQTGWTAPRQFEGRSATGSQHDAATSLPARR